MPKPVLGAFHHVTIGVARLHEAVGFWQGSFGLKVRDRRAGADPALARLWGIAADDITGQALVATPAAAGWAAGALHLVEFRNPLPPVREGARVYDCLPKNLDVYTVDMAARCAELEAAGHRFRAPWAEMAAGEQRFREAQLPGHDDINVVLIEVLGPGYRVPLSPAGYAGIGPLVTIVGDADAEARFYRDTLGMAATLELLLKGPEIERTVGLPPDAGLDIRVFGDPDEPLGRIEIIEYQRVRGKDRYHLARPPARGILHVNYRVSDLVPVRERLAMANVVVTEHGVVDAIYGTGAMLSFRSPAGFRIEVQA
jgi:catechol 2,3-dioxygenase-like lactoylglutathione lyase family enzyme